MLRRWILITAFTVMAVMAASITWSVLQARPPVQSIGEQRGPLIVVSAPRLTFDDTPAARTSALWTLARSGAVGAMTTRGLSDHSCSAQSWLSLSAGVRTSLWKPVNAAPPGQRAECPQAPEPTPIGAGVAQFSDWPAWRKATLARTQAADIGRLAGDLAPIGGPTCITAAGRAAAVGASDRNGFVSNYVADPRRVDFNACDITFVSLNSPDEAFFTHLLQNAPPQSTIVVGSFADDDGPERLHPVVIAGPGVAHGLLTSGSTRQRGIVQLVDLSAFMLTRLGDKAPQLPEARNLLVQPSGSPTTPILRSGEISHALQVEHGFVRQFIITFYCLVVAFLTLGWGAVLAARRAHRPVVQRAAHRFVSFIASTAVAMPVATFIVNALPWWRHDRPRLALGLGVGVIAVALALVALLGPWRRWMGGSMAALCLVTGGVIALDVTHGDDLQLLSMLGLQPVYGGRFYGMGNVAFALLATSALMFAAIVASPLTRGGRGRHGLAALTVALVGAATVVVDAYPGWGADGGGPVALLPAFAYLTINAAGWTLTWVRFFLLSAAGAAIVIGMAALDYLRGPAERTHLGDFFAQVRQNGDFGRAQRIWQANWNMLTSTPLALLVPVILIVLIYALLRPQSVLGAPLQPIFERMPVLRNGMAAVTVCWLMGFLINDSGTAIPPAGLMLLAPMVLMQRARIAANPRPAAEPPAQQ
nr:hypothetical protein [Yimella sp. cx-51]